MGKEQMNALSEEVDKLLEAGFIVPVDNAEWVSSVVVTPKKDGRWRICIDYKPLNVVTKKDPYALPFIDLVLDSVAGFERYSVCEDHIRYFGKHSALWESPNRPNSCNLGISHLKWEKMR